MIEEKILELKKKKKEKNDVETSSTKSQNQPASPGRGTLSSIGESELQQTLQMLHKKQHRGIKKKFGHKMKKMGLWKGKDKHPIFVPPPRLAREFSLDI